MGSIAREYRLTNEPGGLGLSCTAAGLFLAGVPLLRKTDGGFAPRSPAEIRALAKAAFKFEDDVDPARLSRSLAVVARALNRGELAQAMIAAVLARVPELSWESAARLAKREQILGKFDFNPAEPRDWHGRWTTGESAAPASAAAPANDDVTDQEATPTAPHAIDPGQPDAISNSLLTPVVASNGPADDAAPQDNPYEPTPPDREFEQKYDDLGPVEFAKQVIEFGDWLGRNGNNLSPDDKAHALAEYYFLQNRLSFWLGYDYTPPQAQPNLHSAALTLYQGAVIGGLAGPGHLPPSMLDVAGVAWGADSAPPTTRPSFAPRARAPVEPGPSRAPAEEIERLGGVVDNREVAIVWGKGIDEQGDPWEAYNDKIPGVTELHPKAKAFDQFRAFNDSTGEAISSKTLDTLTVSRIKNPQLLYNKLKRYIDNAENYARPRGKLDLDPGKIQSKTIQLAVPEYTSPRQWQYLYSAIFYARAHGVSLIITRIRG